MTDDSIEKKVLITGWSGLLGHHVRAKIFSINCARRFNGQSDKYKIVLSTRLNKSNQSKLIDQIRDADIVLHFAGINRADDKKLEYGNEALAQCLIDALLTVKSPPCVVYSNSTHCKMDTAYGRGKLRADSLFKKWAKSTNARYINLVLPHLFGEFSQPFYNTVTATFCRQLVEGVNSDVSKSGQVELVHAGNVADI